MRGKIATIAAVAALAVTGTAVAAGGPGAVFGDDKKQELATDLAQQLEGVNAGEVEQALDAVAEDRMAERRAKMAEGIAAQLNGVSADQVADALAKHEEQMRSAFESGERPDRGGIVTALSEELDKSEAEITDALEAAREAGMAEHRAEALERLELAVESGDLTEEQAAEIRDRIESGEGPRGHHGPGGPGGHGGPGGFGPGGPGGPGGFGPGGPGGPGDEGPSDGASNPAPEPTPNTSA